MVHSSMGMARLLLVFSGLVSYCSAQTAEEVEQITAAFRNLQATSAPTSAPGSDVTSFTIDMGVPNSTAFVAADYVASVAAAAGVASSLVTVTSTNYKVAVAMSFTEDINETTMMQGLGASFAASAPAAILAQVAGAAITLTHTDTRRLSEDVRREMGIEGRRLGTTVSASVVTPSGPAADAVLAGCSNTTLIAGSLALLTGTTVLPPTVTTAASLVVVLVTEIAPAAGASSAAAAPTAASVLTEMQTRNPGVTFTVSVDGVAAVTNTTTAAPTTEAPIPGSTSGALDTRPSSIVSMLLAALITLAVAA